MLVRVALFSGFTKVSTVPFGSISNASFVGAKTVNGPGPCNVSTRPAAFTAATRVVWSFELTAFSTIFFEGYIGAPPTVTLISANPGVIPPMNAPLAATMVARAIDFACIRQVILHLLLARPTSRYESRIEEIQ